MNKNAKTKKSGETARQIVEALEAGPTKKASEVIDVNPVLGRLLKAREELEKAAAAYEASQGDATLSVDDPLWNLITHTCPKCNHVGPVAKDFGVRKTTRGSIKTQAWCRSCRAGKQAHPTRYKTVKYN